MDYREATDNIDQDGDLDYLEYAAKLKHNLNEYDKQEKERDRIIIVFILLVLGNMILQWYRWYNR